MPKKPTQPFGHWVFPKEGDGYTEVYRLSEEKTLQERDAILMFSELFNRHNHSDRIVEILQLPEQGHDFQIRLSTGCVTIQLTELVDREFLSEQPIPNQKLMQIFTAPGRQGFVDRERMNSCLKMLIARKLGRRYQKGPNERLWLVIFSTFPFHLELGNQNGEMVPQPSLSIARDYLREARCETFDKIWFTNLTQSNTLIWPERESLE